jgi:hypothetical protein
VSKKKDADEGQDHKTTVEVELAAARWRHFLWAAAGITIGLVMILRMEEIGLVLGGAVLLGGLLSLRSFVMTLIHAPGTIEVRESDVVLPEKVCGRHIRSIPLAELRNAYLLRRALPWNHTGPVLVVETRRGVFHYPRDWFAGEGDQRRVFTTLNRRLGRLP